MATIREQVQAFHEAAKVPTPEVPTIPADERVRLRLQLVTEEALELVSACMGPQSQGAVQDIRQQLQELIRCYPVRPDMVKVADACGDIDYVVEGTRLEFGINGEPVAAEIQRSNMAKFGPGHSFREDGKVLKPPGWTPPDILGELRKQGWTSQG